MKAIEKINVTIKGTRPLLFNKFQEHNAETTKKRGVRPSHDEEAEASLYKNEKGVVCSPSTHIESSMVKSSTDFTMKGKKTYKDAIKSGVIIEPDLIPHQNQKWETFTTPVVIQRARVMKARGLMKEWKLSFIINILDERLNSQTIKEILENSGKFIGIGDWRPKYGLFEIEKFEKYK